MNDVFGDALQKLTPLPKPNAAAPAHLKGSEASPGESPKAAIQLSAAIPVPMAIPADGIRNVCLPTFDVPCQPTVESETSFASADSSVNVAPSESSLTEAVDAPHEDILPFAVAQSSSATIPQTAFEAELASDQESFGEACASEEMPADATVPFSAEVSAANAARSRLEFILDHRRQTAAVVVLICLAIFWFDDGQEKSRSGALSTSAAQSSTSSDDTLLSDFDAVEVRTLREPADPVETDTPDPFPFFIPTAESATTEHYGATTPAVSTSTQASTMGHDNRRTGNHEGASHSPFGPASSSVSHNARLTGQIQPMK